MLLHEIKEYWANRSEGYSEVNRDELGCAQKDKWLAAIEKRIPNRKKSCCKILDIGTGPGFFSIILAEAGYHVTAIDLTEEMLQEARQNAKHLSECIHFQAMNAEALSFDNEMFDVIVTRNLTWNLQNPEKAYEEWLRVLKKDGVLLNFDANWYCYLGDEQKRADYLKDRDRAKQEQVQDFYEGTDIDWMERIAKKLPLSNIHRPAWDLSVMKHLGAAQTTIESDIWKEVWSDEEKINYTTTPMFLVVANK